MWEGSTDVPLPRFAGHEVAGFVESIGKGVTEFSIGDRVALYAEGKGFSEYSVVPAGWAVKLHDSVPFDLALGEHRPQPRREAAPAMEVLEERLSFSGGRSVRL